MNRDADMLTVSSAELVRHFGELRSRGDGNPVFITHHGRTTHVLLPAARYNALAVPAPAASDRDPRPSLDEFADWLPQAVLSIDDDQRVTLANRAACAMAHLDERDFVGRVIGEALPRLRHSLAQAYFNRALSAGEPCSVDLPSIFRDDAWVKLEIFPHAHGATVLIRDITDEVRTLRLADAKQAVLDALSIHPAIGYMGVNARGHVDIISAPMCEMLKLPCERVTGHAVIELVPVAQRAAFREGLEAVLRGEGPRAIDTALLTNEGRILPVSATLAELRGMFGVEGAIIVAEGG